MKWINDNSQEEMEDPEIRHDEKDKIVMEWLFYALDNTVHFTRSPWRRELLLRVGRIQWDNSLAQSGEQISAIFDDFDGTEHDMNLQLWGIGIIRCSKEVDEKMIQEKLDIEKATLTLKMC